MGYPLSLVLAVLFTAYSLATLTAIFCWRRNPSIVINRMTDIINFVLCGVLTVCAWFFEQSTYVDLDRMMEEISQGPDFLLKTYSSQPLSFLLLMVGYWTGDRRVLQCIGCFLTYGLAMLIIAELKRLLSPDPISSYIGTMLYWLFPNFVTAVANIRFWIAVELLLLAAVIWVRTRGWKVPACLAVLGALLHSGVVPVIVGFFLAAVHSEFLFCALSMLVALYSTFILPLVRFFSSSRITPLVYIAKRTAEYYGVGVDQGSYDAAMLAAGGNTAGIRMLCIIIPMVLLYFLMKSSLAISLPAGMEKFIIFELVFTVSSSQSYTVFIRYTFLCLYLMIPVIFCCLNHFFVNDIHPRATKARERGRKTADIVNLASRTLFLAFVLILFFMVLREWGSNYYSSSIVL